MVYRNRRRIIFSLLVALALLCADFMARQSLLAASQDGPDFNHYIRSSPPPYAHSPYYSPEFISETSHLSWDTSDHGYSLPKDQTGTFINFKDGFRRTVGQPAIYKYTLWLLGSSTIEDVYVPDSYTIASQLQARLPDVRVMNVGVSGATFDLQYFRMLDLPIRAGDTVLFYGGSLEAREVYKEATKLRTASLPIPCHLQLSLVYVLCNAAVPPLSFEEQAVNNDFGIYSRIIYRAKDYTRSRGVSFYVILQPMLFTTELSSDELQLPDVMQYRLGMIGAYAEFKHWPSIIDISHCLDLSRREGMRTYLDQMHMTDSGDAIVATAIANIVGVF